jgi:hypothetical protein
MDRAMLRIGSERYFKAGCTRVEMVSWRRGRNDVLNLLRTLAAIRSPANAAVRT